MKKLKRLWTVLILSLVIPLLSSCSLWITPLKFTIPERPKLEVCEVVPNITGTVTERKTVELALEDAKKLKKWILDTAACNEVNMVMLEGHIEKLENRLKALGGRIQ